MGWWFTASAVSKKFWSHLLDQGFSLAAAVLRGVAFVLQLLGALAYSVAICVVGICYYSGSLVEAGLFLQSLLGGAGSCIFQLPLYDYFWLFLLGLAVIIDREFGSG
jgi:hypothetical protein